MLFLVKLNSAGSLLYVEITGDGGKAFAFENNYSGVCSDLWVVFALFTARDHRDLSWFSCASTFSAVHIDSRQQLEPKPQTEVIQEF